MFRQQFCSVPDIFSANLEGRGYNINVIFYNHRIHGFPLSHTLGAFKVRWLKSDTIATCVC